MVYRGKRVEVLIREWFAMQSCTGLCHGPGLCRSL